MRCAERSGCTSELALSNGALFVHVSIPHVSCEIKMSLKQREPPLCFPFSGVGLLALMTRQGSRDQSVISPLFHPVCRSFCRHFLLLSPPPPLPFSFLCRRYVLHEQAQSCAKRYRILGAVNTAIERNGIKVMILLRLSPLVPFSGFNFM